MAIESSKLTSPPSNVITKRPWLTSKTVAVPKNKCRKIRSDNKSSVHAIFQECASLTDDPMWQTVFTSNSMGKFPSGFSFKDRVFTYKTRNRNMSIDVGEEAYEVIAMCKEFYKMTIGMISENDIVLEQERVRELIKDNDTSDDPIDWFSLKKNSYLKSTLISRYVDEQVKIKDLNLWQQEQLRSTIGMAFLFKRFNEKKDIHVMKRNAQIYITAIDGLEFDEKMGEHYINHDSHPLKEPRRTVRRQTEKEKNKKVCTDLWIKFLDDVRKNREKLSLTNTLRSSPQVLSAMTQISIGQLSVSKGILDIPPLPYEVDDESDFGGDDDE